MLRPKHQCAKKNSQQYRWEDAALPIMGVGLLTGFVLLILALSADAYVLFEGIETLSGAGKTQVVISVNGPIEPRSGRLVNPDRLYIDLPDTRLPTGDVTRHITVNDERLQTVRIGQNKPNTVRIVFDLQSLQDYRVWTQKATHRIIVDLQGKLAEGNAPAPAKPKRPPLTIVIDPGHGGKDPGAIGPGGMQEKTIVLQVAKELRSIIKEELPTARVVLTRDRDVFIPLARRARIANEQHARLFVSLHLNASPNRQASGVESWYLSFAANARAKRTAARENMMSESQLSDLEIILRDLYETDRINQSAILAGVMQTALVEHMGKHYTQIVDRGVDGAPFVVLIHTQMPSVLGELAFVSNPQDEGRLRTQSYRRTLARGVFRGIRRFLQTTVVAVD